MKSEDIVSEVANPSRGGQLDGATHVGRSGIKGEGPYMVFWLLVDDNRIVAARAESHGCGYAITTANIVAQKLEGLALAEATLLSADRIAEIVGGLPEGKEYCAALAADALGEIGPCPAPE